MPSEDTSKNNKVVDITTATGTKVREKKTTKKKPSAKKASAKKPSAKKAPKKATTKKVTSKAASSKKLPRRNWAKEIEKFAASGAGVKQFTMSSPGVAQVTAVRLRKDFGADCFTQGASLALRNARPTETVKAAARKRKKK